MDEQHTGDDGIGASNSELEPRVTSPEVCVEKLRLSSPRFRVAVRHARDKGAKLLSFNRGVAQFSYRMSAFLLIDLDTLPEQVAIEFAKRCVATQSPLVCVVGGEAGFHTNFAEHFRFWKVGGFLHVPSRGERFAWRDRHLKRLFAPQQDIGDTAASAASPEELGPWVYAQQTQHASDVTEVTKFQAAHNAQRPFVTYTMVAAVAVMFAAQLFFGIDYTFELVAEGALYPPSLTEDGEWWRLLSCTLLHGSFQHVLFNAYVLFALGSFLEPVMKSSRFMILYFVSALAGSVASAAMLDMGVSVGASGAVWGLLGAHAAMAFKSDGLLPAALVPGAKRAAMINLGLNLFVSFMPNVDMWAHFGGGAAGALTFFIMRPFISKNTSPGMAARGLASVLLLALLAAGGLGLMGASASSQTLADSAIVQAEGFAIPERIAQRSETLNAVGTSSVLFGDLLRDPVVIEAHEFGLDGSTSGLSFPEATESTFQEIVAALDDVPFEEVPVAGGRVLLVRPSSGDEIPAFQLYTVRQADLAILRLDVVYWPGHEPARETLLAIGAANQ